MLSLIDDGDESNLSIYLSVDESSFELFVLSFRKTINVQATPFQIIAEYHTLYDHEYYQIHDEFIAN
ncbi:hypothetical protein DERP_004920 [Dermatophagoides pteronyssinus]|uniref:Uncharacterized protein n=1 Tax=Dermatophagoides pteronyssinus TaxID=6956 RepID=A0ABQ8JTH9_DERPT|nr:hypothetical protein DERP_004920 [Dermatophagoides pteronyssinus]